MRKNLKAVIRWFVSFFFASVRFSLLYWDSVFVPFLFSLSICGHFPLDFNVNPYGSVWAERWTKNVKHTQNEWRKNHLFANQYDTFRFSWPNSLLQFHRFANSNQINGNDYIEMNCKMANKAESLVNLLIYLSWWYQSQCVFESKTSECFDGKCNFNLNGPNFFVLSLSRSL